MCVPGPDNNIPCFRLFSFPRKTGNAAAAAARCHDTITIEDVEERLYLLLLL